jgi:predicted aspartyl protease
VGAFRTACTITNIVHRDRSAVVPERLVDTGSEFTWVPATVLESLGIDREKKDLAFVMANGQQVTRNVGFAILSIEDRLTVDEVVFAQPGDLLLFAARTLEGLNLMVDVQRKRLMAAGPLPAAPSRIESIPHRVGPPTVARRR